MNGEIRVEGMDNVSLSLYNMMGQLIATNDHSLKVGTRTGIHLVQVTENGKTIATQKIVL